MSKRKMNLHAKIAPWLLLTALIAVVPLLAGCAATGASATPTPTKTPRPPTEMPTNTPEPTATMPAPTEPPATEPPAQTDTPAPTEAAAAPTAEPSATAAAAQPTAKPAARPVTGSSMASPDFGAQAFLWWRPEIADRDLQLMQDAGFTWVKQLFSWQDIEGAGNDQYDWSSADRVVDQAAAHGLKLVVRLSQDPDRPFWAGNAPENADHFANFAKAVATRYKGRIAAYQVWKRTEPGARVGQQTARPGGLYRDAAQVVCGDQVG